MTNFITIEGHRIVYQVRGSSSNPPIIFIHGLMSHHGVWKKTIEELKSHYYCISFDQLGFGESDKPKDGNYTIAKQAERALQVANQLGIETFTIAGHSMGGQISAYITSVLAPQRIKKLIFVDGVVTGKLSDFLQKNILPMVKMGGVFPAAYPLLRPLRNWKPYAHWAFQAWLYEIQKAPFDIWEKDRHYATQPGIAHSAPKAWDSVNATNLTPHLKNIIAPTLILFGKHDGTVPVEQAYLFKEQLPSAQLSIIDNCGHFPMYEKFDEYIAPLKTFLKS